MEVCHFFSISIPFQISEKGQRKKNIKKNLKNNYSNQFSMPLQKDDDRNVNPTENQPICAQCFVSLLCQRAPHLQVGLPPHHHHPYVSSHTQTSCTVQPIPEGQLYNKTKRHVSS